MIIKGFETKLQHNRRCDGCGVKIGPDTPVKNGFEVRDGEVRGLFHSRACYLNSAKKFNDQKEGKNEWY